MARITDPNVVDWFSDKMEEVRKQVFHTSDEMIEAGMESCQSHKQFTKSVLDSFSKKCEDDETLFETIHAYKRDKEQKKSLMKEKGDAISQRMSEMQGKDAQKDSIIQKIDMLREEQAKKKELLVCQNKSNKDRLRNLNKAKQVFQDHLGLEIRKIHGEKLQFIFRNINHVNPDSAYTFTLIITGDGVYQIVSSDPQLECMLHLEQRLKETNNFSAFLGNVRKEFVALPKT